MAETTQNLDGDIEMSIEIDIHLIAARLATNPVFIKAIAVAVRNQLTSDARKVGNLYKDRGSVHLTNTTQPPTLNTNKTKRLN